jgi:hypothetical protein
MVRFARLIDRRGRVLGGPTARAACGGSLNLTWLLLRVIAHEGAALPDAQIRVVWSWRSSCWRPAQDRWRAARETHQHGLASRGAGVLDGTSAV